MATGYDGRPPARAGDRGNRYGAGAPYDERSRDGRPPADPSGDGPYDDRRYSDNRYGDNRSGDSGYHDGDRRRYADREPDGRRAPTAVRGAGRTPSRGPVAATFGPAGPFRGAGPELARRPRGPLFTRAALVVALAGLALAGIALPPVAAVGMFYKASADHFVSLPTELVTPPLAQNSRILAADGTFLASLRGATDRVVAPLSTVPPIMQTALVDIEDSRFYSHGGVDVKGVLRAALHDSSSGSQQGGSTLTQQYVKNVLLQQATTKSAREAAAGDSLARKLQEARYAVALEKKLSKKQILERYLNIAYFGDGAYGVGTASLHYFGQPVQRLDLPRAALLAGLVQSPSAYDPFQNPSAAKARRAVVLERMAQLHSITEAQAKAAEAAPLGVKATPPAAVADTCESSSVPFFCDYVRTTLLNDPRLGATRADRERTLYEGGLTIRTTLDPNIQQAVQRTVNAQVEPSNRVSAAEVVVQPGTGDILAMAVNRAYGTNAAANQTKVNLATKASFYPGSTFKTFTLATALEQGYGESTSFYAPACLPGQPLGFPRQSPVKSCPDGFVNDDPAEAGVYDLPKATWNSVNTYYVQLEAKVGVPAVAQMAERLGVPTIPAFDSNPAQGGLTLGIVDESPLTMATAYATLAAHGTRCDPRFVQAATDSAGQDLAIASAPSCTQVLAPGIADTVTSILSGVLTNGTGNPNALAIGRPAAGKTGTNDGFNSAWFVGYTPQVSAAVALGDPRGQYGNPLTAVTINGRYWPKIYGGDLPSIIWAQSLKAALANQPALPLSPPDPAVVAGTKGGLLSTPPPSPTPSAGDPTAPQPPGVIQLPTVGPINMP